MISLQDNIVPITDLDLPLAIQKALMRNGIQTLRQLNALAPSDLKVMRGIGAVSYEKIRAQLAQYKEQDSPVDKKTSASLTPTQTPAATKADSDWLTLFADLTDDDTAVDVLPISDRTIRNFKRASVATIADLVALPRAKLLTIRTVGAQAIRDIQAILHEYAQHRQKLCRIFGDFNPELGHIFGAPLDQIPVGCLAYDQSQTQTLSQAGIDTVASLIDYAYEHPLDEALLPSLKTYLLWLAKQSDGAQDTIHAKLAEDTAVPPLTINLPTLISQWLQPLTADQRHVLLDEFDIFAGGSVPARNGAKSRLSAKQQDTLLTSAISALRDDYEQRGKLLWLPLLTRVRAALAEYGGLLTKEEFRRWVAQTAIETTPVDAFNVMTLLGRIDSTLHSGSHPPMLLQSPYKVANVKDLQDAIADCLDELDQAMTAADLFQVVSQTRPYQKIRLQSQSDPRPFFNACLRHHPNLRQIAGERYRLISKRIRIRDYIITTFNMYGRPLHYKKITELINDHLKPRKALEPLQVYNQLRHHGSQFTRVGRGIFALAEWGLPDDGNLGNAIERVLHEANQPLPLDTIYAEVLKTWQVRKTSIYATLIREERFTSVSYGVYGLSTWLENGAQAPT